MTADGARGVMRKDKKCGVLANLTVVPPPCSGDTGNEVSATPRTIPARTLESAPANPAPSAANASPRPPSHIQADR